MLPTKSDYLTTNDGWATRSWDDGCVQVYRPSRLMQEGSHTDDRHFIERENKAKGPRRMWHVVMRGADKSSRWPELVAGPFPDLDSAKAAYLLLTTK